MIDASPYSYPLLMKQAVALTRTEKSHPFHTGPGVLLTTIPFCLPRTLTLLEGEEDTQVPAFQSVFLGEANR